MEITFIPYDSKYLSKMTEMWNDILEDGLAFPGLDLYADKEFEHYLLDQSAVTCMFVDGELAGYYTIHPNNIGRCSHVANASYCMNKDFRGKRLFNPLVEQSLKDAKRLSFTGMQFNAVVASNYSAIRTYTKNGFEIVGTIRNGFQLKDGSFSNMYIMYRDL